ncbi:MAG: hypothetical protein J6I31_04620 [Prevotella sp.]|jgi:hypothetical protein|nr:hypothetical protein [Prevotella sp.]
MDYRYIEQLLDRYFAAETSLEEESILQSFFSQKEIPSGMEKYRDLFVFRQEEQQTVLGEDFDNRILKMVEGQPQTIVKARQISLSQRLMPLFKAAAVVAVFLSLGQAAQFSLGEDRAEDEINYANYKDTYEDPSVAYDKVESALQLVGESFNAKPSDVILKDSTIIE